MLALLDILLLTTSTAARGPADLVVLLGGRRAVTWRRPGRAPRRRYPWLPVSAPPPGAGALAAANAAGSHLPVAPFSQRHLTFSARLSRNKCPTVSLIEPLGAVPLILG